MRVALSNFPVADCFVDNVAHTLNAMGHQVITPSKMLGRSRSRAVNLLREISDKAFPHYWSSIERWAIASARVNKPDLLIWLTASVRQEVLEELRKIGVKWLVAWWGDPPANMRGLGLLASGWDAIFIKDAAAVAKFRAVGLPAEHLHEAMNPDWHHRNFAQIGSEVIVAGSYYGYRQFLVDCLLRREVPMALYGPPPPRWAIEVIRSAHRGKYIVKEEKSRIFGEGLACLNSTSLAEGDSLNCRAFEIAGACGLQLIEDKPAIAECFEPGAEVLVYSSVDEIVEHCVKATREPSWAMTVREAGHRRAHAHHTYRHRLAHIFERLELLPRQSQT